MANAQTRHGLTLGESLAHALERICHVVAQPVVLARVNAYHKLPVLRRDFHKLLNHGAQVADIVDFLADDVAARDVGVGGNGADNAELPLCVLKRTRLVTNDSQRNTPQRRQKSYRHARFALNLWQNIMSLCEGVSRRLGLCKARVGDLKIAHSALLGTARDPQQLVLKQRQALVLRAFVVKNHLPDRRNDIRIGDIAVVFQLNFFVRDNALRENVAVEIYLLEICEHRLTVLEDSQRGADFRYVERRILKVVENEVGEVYKRVVVNFPGEVLAAQSAVFEPLDGFPSGFLKPLPLPVGTAEL